jgi:hypothetical protein
MNYQWWKMEPHLWGFLMKLHMKKMHGSFVMENKRMAKELFKAEDKEQNDKLNFHNRCVWEVG